MNHIPIDTRRQFKSGSRDEMIFPEPLPNTFNSSFGEFTFQHQPNYDRNMFNSSSLIEVPERRMVNDRLTQSSEIYRHFGESSEKPSPFYGDSVQQASPSYQVTRERRDERKFDEQRNMDRIFMNTRNYDAEVNERLNGFGMMARDTRFESTSRKGSDGKMEMRSNRYLGMPSDNL